MYTHTHTRTHTHTYCILYNICWYLFIDGHLGCFHLLATVNNAAIKMKGQISLLNPVFHPLGYISRSEIAGSWSNSILNFLRICHPVFHSHCPILYFHQRGTMAPISSHPLQHFLFPEKQIFFFLKKGGVKQEGRKRSIKSKKLYFYSKLLGLSYSSK